MLLLPSYYNDEIEAHLHTEKNPFELFCKKNNFPKYFYTTGQIKFL